MINRTIKAVVFLLAFAAGAGAQNTVVNTIANFNITDNGTKFSFDVFTLKTSAPEFRMGNSSYFLRFVAGTFANPELTYINPKYTSGSVTASYDQMRGFGYASGRVAVQLFFNSNGLGDDISADPGVEGFGEKIATVRMDIVALNLPDLRWDNLNTAVVNTQNQSAMSTNNGSYNSTLPVELLAFSAAVTGNSVRLLWSTSAEENNAGFEIQRMPEGGSWTTAGYVEGSGNSAQIREYTFTDRSLGKGKFAYRLKQIDFNGNYEFHELGSMVEIGTPEQFKLHQNYPNPFNPSTVLSFDLPYSSDVTLSVYDLSGRLVRTLINNELRQPDYYKVSFDGSSVSSGVYFYRLQTSKEVQTGKMTLVK
ncbi:MAG: T9SS type A sorting domain-containing protein [Ignavibacteria bacterium]|nr:T9SS type A sorting domain-containing protein [Ignavibacteria bacterium]